MWKCENCGLELPIDPKGPVFCKCQIKMADSLPEVINFYSALAVITFFGFAQVTYFLHALFKDTENQFSKPYRLGNWFYPSFLQHLFMVLLIIGELGGFMILFWGFIRTF